MTLLAEDGSAEPTICGRCGKTVAANVPLGYRIPTECKCDSDYITPVLTPDPYRLLLDRDIPKK